MPTAFGYPVELNAAKVKNYSVFSVGGKKFRSDYLQAADQRNNNGLDEIDEYAWDELENNFLEFNDSNTSNNNTHEESLVNHQPVNADNEDEEKQIAKLMRTTHLGNLELLPHSISNFKFQFFFLVRFVA